MRRQGKAAKGSKEWATPAGRVKWLLVHRWAHNRSAMARDIEATHTAIVKVVTGQQEPGRRLLALIATHTDVSADWLLTGRGQPFTPPAIPVAHQPLPGPPLQHANHLVDDQVEGFAHLYSPSRYWLRIEGSEPVCRDTIQKIKRGDLILFETDRQLFPPPERFTDRMCIVRVPETKPAEFRLAAVQFHEATVDRGGEQLEADTFWFDGEVITQFIVEVHPRGETCVHERQVRRVMSEGARQFARTQPADPFDPRLHPLRIDAADIVAVGILIVRRCGIG